MRKKLGLVDLSNQILNQIKAGDGAPSCICSCANCDCSCDAIGTLGLSPSGSLGKNAANYSYTNSMSAPPPSPK